MSKLLWEVRREIGMPRKCTGNRHVSSVTHSQALTASKRWASAHSLSKAFRPMVASTSSEVAQTLIESLASRRYFPSAELFHPCMPLKISNRLDQRRLSVVLLFEAWCSKSVRQSWWWTSCSCSDLVVLRLRLVAQESQLFRLCWLACSLHLLIHYWILL